MAVAMSYKSPFTLPPASMRRAADTAKVQLSRNSESDQVSAVVLCETSVPVTKTLISFFLSLSPAGHHPLRVGAEKTIEPGNFQRLLSPQLYWHFNYADGFRLAQKPH